MNSIIKYYQSTQTGAPQLSGQTGTLVSVLNACLVTGFNLRTLTRITRADALATAFADAGHGFREGDMVLLSGALETAFNGEFRIRNVTTNSFQFDLVFVAGAEPPLAATGALTAKIAPMGWENPFADANKAVFRSRDVAGTRLFLRIDDTSLPGDANYGRGARSASAQMWETMTDVDNGTGMSQSWWRKAQNESTTARPWLLVGDSRCFWLLVAWSETYDKRFVPYFFGDLDSFKAGDAYGCLIGGYVELPYNWYEPVYNEIVDSVCSLSTTVGNTGIWLARAATQLGGHVNAQWVAACGPGGNNGLGSSLLPFPNPVDNGIYVMPLMVMEQTGPALRGRLPGLLCPLHAIPAAEPTVYEGFVIDGTTRDLLAVCGAAGNSSTRLAFDLTGPWR